MNIPPPILLLKMSKTKKLIHQFISLDATNIVYSYISPSKKRKRNPEGSLYYLSCCFVGLVEEFQRLRPKFPNKDEDVLYQAAAGNNFELVKYMVSLGIRDEKSNVIDLAICRNHYDIVEFLAEDTQQWFLSLHLTGMTLRREHSNFIDNLLYLGACNDNEFLVKFALLRGADELDEAENVALERNHAVAKIISDHIEAL